MWACPLATIELNLRKAWGSEERIRVRKHYRLTARLQFFNVQSFRVRTRLYLAVAGYCPCTWT